MKIVAETGLIDSGERALETESGMEYNAFLTESISNVYESACSFPDIKLFCDCDCQILIARSSS